MEFLDSLELHATAAQIDLNDLPQHVLQYCGHKVCYTIELAPYWKQNDWVGTHAYLIKLYGSNDCRCHFTMEKFWKWVDEHSDRKSFSNVQDVDQYYWDFMAHAAPLIAESRLLDNKANILFLSGIPKSMKKSIHKNLLATHTTVQSPPNCDDVLVLLQKEFDEDNLANHNSFSLDDKDESSDSDKDNSDNLDDDYWCSSKSSHKMKKKVKFDTTKPSPVSLPDQTAHMAIDVLTKQMQDIQLLLRELAAIRTSENTAVPAVPTVPQADTEQQCLICDKPNTHRVGVHNCPEVKVLFQEGLVVYTPDGKLMWANGSNLPRGIIGNGSVAKQLRDKKVTEVKAERAGTPLLIWLWMWVCNWMVRIY